MSWQQLYIGRGHNFHGARGILYAAVFVLCVGAVCSNGAPWRLAVMSDSQGRDDGVNARILGELAQDIANRDVEAVIFCGDLIAGRSLPFEDMLRNWRSVMKPVYDANIAVYPCRGNHDAMREIKDWQNVFADLPDNGPTGEKHLTYSAAHKNVLIVALDDFVGRHRVNQTWLDSELAANKRPHIFAFGHLPAFAAYHNDCLDEHADERDTFWISLKDAGARTYFSGHDHFYDHAHVDDGDGDPNNDIHQYIVGTAGAGFYGWMPPYDGNNGDFAVEQWYHMANYGYVLVEVDDLEVTLSWMGRMMGTEGEWEYRAEDVWSYAVPQEITVLWPSGGELLVSGREYGIEWRTDTKVEIEHVVIEYMTDTSTRWHEVATAPNSGSYQWTVPPVDSQLCMVRVSNSQDRTVGDMSEDPFTIFQCRGPIGGDVDGDCYADFSDLAMIASDWPEETRLLQIAVLADAWCRCGNPFDESCGE